MSAHIPRVLVIAVSMAALPAVARERLVLIEHADTDAVVHVGGSVDAAGDLMTFADPIFDAADRVRLGSDHGYCVRVVLGKSWECFWTLSLAGGTITCEGTYFEEGDSVFAVTGGTGRYAGAAGAVSVHARDAKGSAYDFLYELR